MVDAYNQHMHAFYEKPELFDKNGFRVAHPKSDSSGNKVQIKLQIRTLPTKEGNISRVTIGGAAG